MLSLVTFLFISNQDKMEDEEKPKFQGPVPVGYDEEHFRETGILKEENSQE